MFVTLTRRHLCPARCADQRVEGQPRPLRRSVRAELEQRIECGGRLALCLVRATQRDEARGELDPRLRGLERRAALLEAVNRVLEEWTGPRVIAAGGREHAFGQVGSGPERSGSDQSFQLAQGVELRRGFLEIAARDPRAEEELDGRGPVELALLGHVAKQPFEELDRPERLASVERQAGAAQLGRRG
jgi:hypothetical protein